MGATKGRDDDDNYKKDDESKPPPYDEVEKESPVSYWRLFRFATKFELFLIFLGIAFTIIKAFAMPLLIITYGEFTKLLVDRNYRIGTSSKTVLLQIFGGGKQLTNASYEENMEEIINDSSSYGILMTIISAIHFVAGIFSIDLFNYTSLKQITRMRTQFFRSLLRQEVGWYDVASGNNNFSVRITDDVEKIREGIGEKVSHFLCLMFGFIICVALSFAYGWKLTLVVIAYVPILLVTNVIVARFQAILSAREISAYSVASSMVEEVLGGIRTVVAFCGEKKESERFEKLLVPAKKAGNLKGLSSGIGEGIMRFMFFASNALAYWYGVYLILLDRDKVEKEYTPAVMMITFFGLIVGAENIAKSAPFLECFAAARGSAASIFKIIDRKSKIDAMSMDGQIIAGGISGHIEFNQVHFQYPSRPDVQILRGLSLNIKAGETIALVGTSGNGKSTCLQLLQRFYDPVEGAVYIDGIDIRKMNVSWLRSNIAVVGQEPVLFSTTIFENIQYGKQDATRKEIEAAAKESGAHDFISKLPEEYNTLVGERGCQLSGGQKQRIAIARALIQNPKILLLDEATSALDTQSEKYVQAAMELASKGRTTIIVSHRLSAIRNADRIVFIDKGQILEDGTHEELVAIKGYYFKMIRGGSKQEDDDIGMTHNMALQQNVNTLDVEEHNKLIDKQLFSDHHVYFTADSKQDEDNDNSFNDVHYGNVFYRILKLARPEWFMLFVASISACLLGASFPAFAILFGEFYAALSLESPDDATHNTNMLCIAFLAIGVLMGISAFLQTYLFNLAGVHLTSRIRSLTFNAMMKQEMGWFDEERNAIGALSVRLSSDAANVQGAIGFPLSGIIQSISTFAFGVSTAFVYSWKLALVCLTTVPLIILAVIFEAKYMTKTAGSEKMAMEGVTKLATEAISNIRTVAGLTREPHIAVKYCTEIYKVEKSIRKKMIFRGLVNSTGQTIPFFGYAMALYYGGMLVAKEGLPFANVVKVSEALLYGAMMLGQSLAFIPLFTAGFLAGHRIFKIIDRESRIRSPEIYNLNRKPDNAHNIEYRKVSFRYPTRPDVQVLQGLQLEVAEGKTVALVGASGCGKSTCIQLLQRLYDPDYGRIFIGNDEISRDIPVSDLRSKLSIVSQEPILFDRTISENIAYGDNTRTIDESEIIEAAKIANIHSFIIGLPAGYDTNLGSKGTQLSGGQKQRIAIARALVRNPKVLLLDEATSALDIHSEKQVQVALDIARASRTCLVIAHRLSTIQNADLICVLQQGKIYEMGTHQQLLAQGGLYCRLHKMQTGV